jgi:hypothetical protein
LRVAGGGVNDQLEREFPLAPAPAGR